MGLDCTIEELLAQLAQFVAAYPTRCYFNPPATASDIVEIEKQLNLMLPYSYRQFLLSFNGGFISLDWDSTDPLWDKETAAWNSNHLLGLAELAQAYTDMRDTWQLDHKWPGLWLYLPFCHTEGQEFLVFSPVDPIIQESQILDAFHELWPHEWDMLYPDFSALLRDYLEQEGRLRLVAG
ncbi:MAG: SMI1/KNR4 family protein [Anaerolineae bacterium]